VIFAFQVLSIIIFIASFFSILYYLGVMQWIVKGMAIVMQKVMGVSGAESLNVAASIFMGQTEAPLTIKPFLEGLTESELFTIMTSGMAHVSGSVMAAYVMVAHVSITHLLTAVIMTAPATIMLAKIFVPETGKPVTAGKVEIKVEKTAVNVIDAAAQGAHDGLFLALNVGGMLIAFLALIAMLNGILGWVHTLPLMGWLPGSLQGIFGVVFAPVAWIMGVAWKDCSAIGNLLGTRLVTNEFVAFVDLGKIKGRSIRARSSSPPMRCAGSPISAPSPSRLAASAAGAVAQVRPGAPRPARRGRGHHGQFHVGLHCRNDLVIAEAKA
jgi:concentrative nucleoside transporter, CNT family